MGNTYCRFRNFCECFSFVKIKPSRNDEITLSFTNVDKPCPIHEYFMLHTIPKKCNSRKNLEFTVYSKTSKCNRHMNFVLTINRISYLNIIRQTITISGLQGHYTSACNEYLRVYYYSTYTYSV